MLRRLIPTMALLTLAAACGLAGFTVDVSEKFKLPVTVNVAKGAHMTLTFENVSADRFSDAAARDEFAKEVASFARPSTPRRAS